MGLRFGGSGISGGWWGGRGRGARCSQGIASRGCGDSPEVQQGQSHLRGLDRPLFPFGSPPPSPLAPGPLRAERMVWGPVLPLCPVSQQQATGRGRRHLRDSLLVLLGPSSEAPLPLIPHKAPTPGKGSHERGPAGYGGGSGSPTSTHAQGARDIWGTQPNRMLCSTSRTPKIPTGVPWKGEGGRGDPG